NHAPDFTSSPAPLPPPLSSPTTNHIVVLLIFSFRILRRPPTSPLFPYTTLFRSGSSRRDRGTRPASRSTPWTPGPQTREATGSRSEEHTSELQSRGHLVCRLLLEKKKTQL